MNDREISAAIDRALSDSVTDEDVVALAELGDERVGLALAGNENLSAQALQLVADTFPVLRGAVALQVAAPAHIKEAYPVSYHSPASLERYLTDKRATHDQRVRFFAIADLAPAGSPSELLGDVWLSVSDSR